MHPTVDLCSIDPAHLWSAKTRRDTTGGPGTAALPAVTSPVGAEDFVEGPGELAVTITDRELDSRRPFGQLEREIARLLGDLAGTRVGGDAGHTEEPGVEFDEYEHIQTPKQHGVDAEGARSAWSVRLVDWYVSTCEMRVHG